MRYDHHDVAVARGAAGARKHDVGGARRAQQQAAALQLHGRLLTAARLCAIATSELRMLGEGKCTGIEREVDEDTGSGAAVAGEDEGGGAHGGAGGMKWRAAGVGRGGMRVDDDTRCGCTVMLDEGTAVAADDRAAATVAAE